MLKLARSVLTRRGGYQALKFKPYTVEDIDPSKNIGELHVGRLKEYDAEDINDYVPSEEYNISAEKTFTSQKKLVEQTNETDALYSHIDLEICAHDNPIINSYRKFIQLACKELDVKNDWFQCKPIYMRRTLLRSAHVHKKYRVQYEIRHYSQVVRLHQLTGTSANVIRKY